MPYNAPIGLRQLGEDTILGCLFGTQREIVLK